MKYGYDLGGAEFPIQPETHTVVDILTPQTRMACDYVIRDLNSPDWTNGLARRPQIYAGRVLRYLGKDRLRPLGQELTGLLRLHGTIVLFDSMDVLGPTMEGILTRFGMRPVGLLEINPAEDSESRADWQAVFVKTA
jgi:hypothetical protein